LLKENYGIPETKTRRCTPVKQYRFLKSTSGYSLLGNPVLTPSIKMKLYVRGFTNKLHEYYYRSLSEV